jgi:hypothetical protein
MVAAVGGRFKAQQSIPQNTRNRRHLKGGQPMRAFKTILGTTALLAGLAFASAAHAQVIVSIGVPPVCAYGYYDYAPYACSPYGFYGPGYFYNGIFLGMGPWAGWGYGHGWGGHRFVSEGGGSYHGGGGALANRSNYARGGGGGGVHASTARVSTTHAAGASRGAVSNAGAARPSAAHSAPARSSGGGSHEAPSHSGGGGSHAAPSHSGGGGGKH